VVALGAVVCGYFMRDTPRPAVPSPEMDAALH